MSSPASAIFHSHINAVLRPNNSLGNRIVQLYNLVIAFSVAGIGSTLLALFDPVLGLLALFVSLTSIVVGRWILAQCVTRTAHTMEHNGTLERYLTLWSEMMVVGLHPYLPVGTVITEFNLIPTHTLHGTDSESGLIHTSNAQTHDIRDIHTNTVYRNLAATTRYAAMMETMPLAWERYVYGKTVPFALNRLPAPAPHTISAHRRLAVEALLARHKAPPA